MNDAYYYSFKAGHHGSHSSSGHGKGHHGKKGKSHIGHLEENLKHDKNVHEAQSIADQHNKQIQSHEKSRQHAVDQTRAHGKRHTRNDNANNLLPANPKHPFNPAKYKHNISDKTKRQQGSDAIDIAHIKGQKVGIVDNLSSYAHQEDNNHLLLVLGITGLTVLALSLNKFI